MTDIALYSGYTGKKTFWLKHKVKGNSLDEGVTLEYNANIICVNEKSEEMGKKK